MLAMGSDFGYNCQNNEGMSPEQLWIATCRRLQINVKY